MNTDHMVFCFGSNERGIHGAGAARFALQKKGAYRYVGFGPMGQSFAIPTKNWAIAPLPIEAVEHYVQRFLSYARLNDNEQFQVTAVGCGLAGFTHEQIAPLFRDAPSNCFFDTLWRPWLPDKGFWGTY